MADFAGRWIGRIEGTNSGNSLMEDSYSFYSTDVVGRTTPTAVLEWGFEVPLPFSPALVQTSGSLSAAMNNVA